MRKASKLFLVRHGQTDWNRDGRFLGLSDVALNEEGKRQAQALALAFNGQGLSAIYSSPLSRARDTAQAIAQFHPLEVKVAEGLKELDSGECEGLTMPQFRERYQHVLSQGPHIPFPGGESLQTLQGRAWGAVMSILERHQDGTALVVTHALTGLAILYKILGLELGQWGKIRLELASRSLLEFGEGSPRLLLLNDTCHLSAS